MIIVCKCETMLCFFSKVHGTLTSSSRNSERLNSISKLVIEVATDIAICKYITSTKYHHFK